MSTTETNRTNAQHSTGPKTESGKKRSAQNAVTHGLTAQNPLLPTEDPAAYQTHLKSFADEYNPQGPTEEHLVQFLADTSWRLNRIASLEAKVLALDAPLEIQIKALANLSLHTQRLSRQFEKTVVHLRSLQQPRQAQHKKELDDLLEILDMFDAKKKSYDPAEDGFVFSQSEIDSASLARNREFLAEEARDYNS